MKPLYELGDKINKLTIRGKTICETPSGRRRSHYLCECDCGSNKLVKVEGHNLKNGRVKSCGCLRKRAEGKSHLIEYRLWKSAQERANKKGWEFSITLEDIIIPEMCPLLEIPIQTHSTRERHFDAPSLDRIDSRKGYTPDNIWVISHRANQIKNDATIDELKLITENLSKQCYSQPS